MPFSHLIAQSQKTKPKTKTITDKQTRVTTSKEARDQAISMYEQGATWIQITKETGLKPTSIRHHLKRRGVPLRSKK